MKGVLVLFIRMIYKDYIEWSFVYLVFKICDI